MEMCTVNETISIILSVFQSIIFPSIYLQVVLREQRPKDRFVMARHRVVVTS